MRELLIWFLQTSTILLEVLGVLAIMLSVFFASSACVMRFGKGQAADTYRQFRVDLGRGILIGLELLIAADILRSLVISPSLENIAVLAGVVLVRTFLSFSLQVEIDGHWPWSRTVRSTVKAE